MNQSKVNESMITKPLLKESHFAPLRVREKVKAPVINLAVVMKIKQAHRLLKKHCQGAAKIASEISQDLEECCSDVEKMRKDLSHLNGAITENGITGT